MLPIPSIHKRLHGPLAAVIALAVTLPGLGTSGLLDPWEMDRAAVARHVAGAPRVLVVDGDGKLFGTLDKAAAGTMAIEAARGAGQTTAAAALGRVDAKLGKRVHHAVVIDADAVLSDGTGDRGRKKTEKSARDHAGHDLLASRISDIRANNRGTLLLLVTAGDPDDIRRELAQGRARALRQTMAGGWWQHALPDATDAHHLWPLMLGDDRIVTRAEAADTLLADCPSPWSLVQHKVDGASVQAPLLDTWLVAASVRAFGSSETSVRLPGALCLALLAWLLVEGGTLLLGASTAWLALLALLTMPMTLGTARIVTLAQTEPIGLLCATLGVGLLATGRCPNWWLWLAAGLLVLLLGGGLGGLSIGVVVIVGYVVAARDFRKKALLAAGLALLTVGLAAWVVLTDDDSAILRTLRFTRVPFGGGLPDDRRGLAVLVSHIGFGLYPWGPLLLIGCGRMLMGNESAGAADDADDDVQTRRDIGLLLGLGAAIIGTMLLIPGFHHVALPLVPIAALIIAILLTDVVRGRATGAVLALLIFVPALLLHRETGKDAGVLVRWLAYDPPFGGERAVHTWPQELIVNRAVRAVTLLLTLGFGLAVARPITALRHITTGLQGRRATLWAVGAVMAAWVLDVLISLGTRLDVLLRSEATRTGYDYDRIWTTIQMTRPELVAGATLFAVLFIAALLVDVGRSRGFGERRWARFFGAVSGPFARPAVGLTAIAAAAVGALISGIMVHLDVVRQGVGAALLVAAQSGAFVAPLVLLLIIATLVAVPRLLGDRYTWASADRATDLSMALAIIAKGRVGALATVALVALGGLGIGASQAAGTWSYGFLAACWGLAVAVGLTVGSRARGSDTIGLGAMGLATVGVAVVVAGGAWSMLAGRLLVEPNGPGLKYLVRVLVASPDTGALLLVAGALLLNRRAERSDLVALVRDYCWKAVGLVERPRISVAMMGVAAAVLGAGYAYGLLPGMSLHFSQKHLLARVAQAGGTASDDIPRTYKHASGGTSSIDTNFYTRSMPTITDRSAVLDLLGGVDVATRISDFGERGRSLNIVVPGWSDDNDKDHDGKRDHKAFAALAAKVDGLSVQVAAPAQLSDADDDDDEPKAALPSNAFKGARLFAIDGNPVKIVSNDTTTLRLAAPISLIAKDPRRGLLSVDTNPGEGAFRSTAMTRGGRFVVLAKDEFSTINHAFRERWGRLLPVLDARSSRLVMAATRLPDGFKDENWLRKVILNEADFAALSGVTRVTANFDDRFEIIGYRLAAPTVRRAQKYKLELFIKVHKAVDESYKLFMHPHPLHRDLWPLDYKPETAATEKRCQGCFQTDHWRVGDVVVVPIEQEVPLGTSAGPNDIILGWYNPLNDKRLQLISARGPGVFKHNDNRVTIGKLQVQ